MRQLSSACGRRQGMLGDGLSGRICDLGKSQAELTRLVRERAGMHTRIGLTDLTDMADLVQHGALLCEQQQQCNA
ncbi:MAG: hypothetical protein JOY91_00610 [Sinobacteraceae bacterium]|nr:hypothetical protein [Nevskiaceae bacterium]